MNLWEALGATRGSVVSVLGAGGKTSSLLTLAREASAAGLTVLVTTTTKMWLPDLPMMFSNHTARLDHGLRVALQQEPIVAAGAAELDGKLLGLSPHVLCSLASPDVILCEADGAAGKSLKIHRPGEPVVPVCTTHLIVVAGLDAIGRSFADVGHPADLSAQYFGRPETAPVTADHLAGALLEGARFRPHTSSLIFLLNKAEGQDRLDAAGRVAQQVRAAAPDGTVLLVSRGRLLSRFGG